MLERYKNFNIKKKIIVGFTCVNILLSLLIILTLLIMNISYSKYECAYSDYAILAAETADAETAYQKAIGNVRTIVIASSMGGPAEGMEIPEGVDPEMEKGDMIEEINVAVEDMKTKVADLGDKIEPEATEAVEQYKILQEAIAAITENANIAIASVQSGDVSSTMNVIISDEFMAQSDTVEASFDALYDALLAHGDEIITGLQLNMKVTMLGVFIIFAIMLTVIIIIIRVTSVSLKMPVYNMRDGAAMLAEGDVNAEIQHFYDDELGELADALNTMQANIKAQAEVAKEISEGNLNIDFSSNGENDLLGNSIYKMIKEENRVMSGITEAVLEIKAGSQEVASASQSLAQGSTEQASAIEQITASITDITERTKINANDANTANELVSKAKDDANESTSKMREMISAMDDINKSSEDISKIIKVIDDIAFQTNILALNAAVEAARAGTHGRGFAVVADEVRNLAGKSAQAASETAELIEDSIARVERGSKLAEETAGALETIAEVIDRIVGITNSIAIASNDQATAISQINTAIGQVSQVVQTNSATSEECAAASEQLSAQAGKLREMIGRYRLKETKGGYSKSQYSSFDEPTGIPEDDFRNDVPPVISLDEGFGKY